MVDAALAALFARVGRKVEHIPDVGAPKIGHPLDLLAELLVVVFLIALGEISHFGGT